LVLGLSKLDEESLSSLVVLHGLCSLELEKAYDGKKLSFPAHSFPRLQILVIWDAPQLDQVNMEEGALASLFKLRFIECPELKCLPRGIENLAALEVLHLEDTAEELIEKLMQKCNADEGPKGRPEGG
jgi:disease resistance protein RPM1